MWYNTLVFRRGGKKGPPFFLPSPFFRGVWAALEYMEYTRMEKALQCIYVTICIWIYLFFNELIIYFFIYIIFCLPFKCKNFVLSRHLILKWIFFRSKSLYIRFKYTLCRYNIFLKMSLEVFLSFFFSFPKILWKNYTVQI